MKSFCKNCGEVFKPKNTNQIYCSINCRPEYYKPIKDRLIESTCPQCNTNFKFPEKQIKTRKFCSTKCREEFNSKSTATKKTSYKKKCIRKGCQNTFEIKPPITKKDYCSLECRDLANASRKRKNHKGKAKCKECKTTFYKITASQIFCSQSCSQKNQKGKTRARTREIIKIKEAKEVKKRNFTNFLELELYNEHDFEKWFKNNYVLFGIKKLIKIDVFFPDVIAELYSGEVVRIELEYKAQNFVLHGHDPGNCDLIICYANNYGNPNVAGLPVIPIFESRFKESGNNSSIINSTRRVSQYFQNILDLSNKQFKEIISPKHIKDKIKYSPYQALK